MKVIFVGDDSRSARMVRISIGLRWPDTTPVVAPAVASGLQLIERESPDIVLFEAGLPGHNLLQTIKEVRRFSSVPILVLGEPEDTNEVVSALMEGADDYVRLPCSFTELMVRVWALVRRNGVRVFNRGDALLVSGELLVNPNTYEVFVGERRVALTGTEFRLLHLLVRNRGAVLPQQALERAIRGDREVEDANGLVKKYVQRLRGKLGDDPGEPRWIANVHGVGYRFVGPRDTPEQQPGNPY